MDPGGYEGEKWTGVSMVIPHPQFFNGKRTLPRQTHHIPAYVSICEQFQKDQNQASNTLSSPANCDQTQILGALLLP